MTKWIFFPEFTDGHYEKIYNGDITTIKFRFHSTTYISGLHLPMIGFGQVYLAKVTSSGI